MDFNETCVLIVLAVCCFVANVLHGLTGCGSILVLHALWQTAVTFAPEVLHGTDAFGDENVKSIAEFSYVLTFFIQFVLTGLLFFGERRRRVQQLAQGVPPAPSELNGVLLLAFIPCSFLGAAVGVYTMPAVHENGSRIILGGSSLFFALTFLSLYQMKYLEKKKTEDVIRDDLMLMRMQSEVQRHVILQYMEDQRRRKQRKERRRRNRALRQQAKKAKKIRRHEQLMKALMANNSNTNNANSNVSKTAAAASGNGGDASQMVMVPLIEGNEGDMMSVPELEGAPLEPNLGLRSPNNAANQRSGSASDTHTSRRTSRPLEVHGASPVLPPHAYLVSDVHLPKSVTGGDETISAGFPMSTGRHRRRHHLHRFWIEEMDVQTYTRQRLSEISRNVDSSCKELAREAQLAAWTLRAMEGHEGGGDIMSPYRSSPGGSRPSSGSHSRSSSSSSSSTGDNSDTEGDSSTVTSTTSSATQYTSSRAERKRSRLGAESEPADAADPRTRAVRFDHNSEAAAAKEKAALHKGWRALLGKGSDKDGDESIDLTKSIAMAAATAPRRVVMGHTEVLNIGLREAQQQQLKSLQELNAHEYARDHHHHRLVHFMRMDGGVVMSAMISSFFSGLLGSYTGVADPPLMIFALAMDISVPELRINYAVSSIVPATLRAVVGIADGFAYKSLFVYYFVSVVFAWGGVAFGLHISRHNAVTHATFMISTLATLLLVAFLMLVPIKEAFIRFLATAACCAIVAVAIFRQQKQPEHHRPPAPPNTPATAAEVEAFQLYWRQHSRRQEAIDAYEKEGSVLSMNSNTSAFLGDSERSGDSVRSASVSASVSPTPKAHPLPPPPQQQRDRKYLLARRSALQSEGLPVRSREDEAEELIIIVPVKAASNK
ncbi:hypothetical protein ABB37_04525 [Leptomonas pyrrhocoris]|uniref:Uncharacterized protein n=1 Tax=Leptomonas pyrrhocoris TaxID=157538 RepID=A0A0M9G304_LEPPY|nr:hypothetical protein ABB37_04525 [Leptomonas pyrrhocoris]KPA81187.1 hypothetical protein ABB37_04525 [Leptomonas pyrrhocoris]|eukprot:XP_015659626.1 hypothetical protein ABB37_04525 [Leptomonas pyrrhocoris]